MNIVDDVLRSDWRESLVLERPLRAVVKNERFFSRWKAPLYRNCHGRARWRAVLRRRARVFREFLTQMLADYKIQAGRFHVAGVSNGGISAFTVAAAYPQQFWSVTSFSSLPAG